MMTRARTLTIAAATAVFTIAAGLAGSTNAQETSKPSAEACDYCSSLDEVVTRQIISAYAPLEGYAANARPQPAPGGTVAMTQPLSARVGVCLTGPGCSAQPQR